MERTPLESQDDLGGSSAYTKRAAEACRLRVEDLCVQVLRQLLLRNRQVEVTATDRWSYVGHRGLLRPSSWGRMWVRVDGLKFAFEWTLVRHKDDKDYGQDRLVVRWSRDPDHTYGRGGTPQPSPDCMKFTEPRTRTFDPVKITEALERYLVLRRAAKERAAAAALVEERRARSERALSEAVKASAVVVGATGATARVRKPTAGGEPLRYQVDFHWSFQNEDAAHAMLDTLREAFAKAEVRATEAAFSLP